MQSGLFYGSFSVKFNSETNWGIYICTRNGGDVLVCLLNEVTVDECCGDVKCIYFGACNDIAQSVPLDDSVDSIEDDKSENSEFNQEGFQTVFEESDILESMSISEDEDEMVLPDDPNIIDKFKENRTASKETKKTCKELQKKMRATSVDSIQL